MAEGIKESILYCSFCGKSQKEVKRLIAGPTVFICNECTELCRQICDNEEDFTKDTDKMIEVRGLINQIEVKFGELKSLYNKLHNLL